MSRIRNYLKFMNKKLLLSLIVSLVSCLNSANGIDLFETYVKSVAYNADYLKAIASNLAGQEQENIARAALLPQIAASAQLTENYFDQGGVQAWYHQPIYAATLNQVIFDFSKFSTYSKGKFASQLSDLQLINSRQQLMVSVGQAYFDVLYATDTLLATQKTKTALEKQMNQSKKAFEVGGVTIADVNDALAGFDAAAAQEIQDTTNLIYKKNIFRNLTGIDPEQIQPIQDDINLLLPNPSNVDSWSQLAESGNLNVLIAAKQLVMAREDISISRGGHVPIISLIGQYQYQDTGGVDASNANAAQMQALSGAGGVSPLASYATGAIGLQISLPISSGGGISATVRQAIDNYEGSQQQLSSVERQIDQNIRNAYWQVQNGVSIVLAQKAALKSAKSKLDSDQLGYQVGIRNSVDLVNSQKDYYRTFQNYQQSRYQYLMAQLQLEYLSGTINEQFMQKVNANIRN